MGHYKPDSATPVLPRSHTPGQRLHNAESVLCNIGKYSAFLNSRDPARTQFQCLSLCRGFRSDYRANIQHGTNWTCLPLDALVLQHSECYTRWLIHTAGILKPSVRACFPTASHDNVILLAIASLVTAIRMTDQSITHQNPARTS